MAIIIDGDARTFRAAVYGRPADSTIEFLRSQFDSPTDSLLMAESSFFQGARRLFEDSHSDDALEKIDLVRRNMARVWDIDEVYEMRTREDFQTAKPAMRRWTMASPYLRGLFQAGRIEGYGEGYIDISPGDIGNTHHDYRLVMSGMMEDDPVNDWSATTYADTPLEDDPELTYQQRRAIIDSWNNAEMLMLFGDQDITSESNNKWR